MSNKINLIGKRFGRLLVLKEVEERRKEKIYWECLCDCGNVKEICGGSLNSGLTQSCGCYHIDQASAANAEYNIYNLSGEFGIGLLHNRPEKEFYFDLEDYDLIKDYCWSINTSDGYVYAYLSRNPFKHVAIHRLILDFPDCKIDHENRNKMDNRKNNLRLATDMQNSQNCSLRKDNKTGVIGVEIVTEKSWSAKIIVNKVQKWLGTYRNFDEAVIARLLAEKEYFGEFAPQQHLYKQYGIE